MFSELDITASCWDTFPAINTDSRTEGRTAHIPHLFWNGSTSTSGCQLESEFSLFLMCVTWYWVFEAVESLWSQFFFFFFLVAQNSFFSSVNSLHIKSTKVAAYVKETCANKTFSLHMHSLWFHTVWNDLHALWMFVLSIELFINREHLYNFSFCLFAHTEEHERDINKPKREAQTSISAILINIKAFSILHLICMSTQNNFLTNLDWPCLCWWLSEVAGWLRIRLMNILISLPVTVSA